MPITINDLCNLPDLALELATAPESGDSPVRWVHVSELDDPTPWLRGGEFVLLAGVILDHSDEALRAYVRRMRLGGACGIGIGLGVRFDSIPKAMLDEAKGVDFAIVAVPPETPFVAVTEAASILLNADRYESIERSLDAQSRLFKAMLKGKSTFIAELGRSFGGWAAEIDRSSDVVHIHPPSAVADVEELRRQVRRARERGSAFSAAISGTTSTKLMQPILIDSHAVSFIAAGADRPPEDADRIIIGYAASLMTLEYVQAKKEKERSLRRRRPLLNEIFRSGTLSPAASRALEEWGLGAGSVSVCALSVPASLGDQYLDLIIESFSETSTPGGCIALPDGRRTRLLALSPSDGEVVEDIIAFARSEPGAVLGISGPKPVSEVLAASAEASEAVGYAAAHEMTICRYGEISSLDRLLNSAPPEAREMFLTAVLGDLRLEVLDKQSGALRETLAAYLRHQGRLSETARELGIHRHTLTGRIARIEKLTGRRMEDSEALLELAFALRLDLE